jgi:hypothetical protein
MQKLTFLSAISILSILSFPTRVVAGLAPDETSRLKIGIGPSTSSACAHGCGDAAEVDARVKYRSFVSLAKRYGMIISMGCFYGKGNLFGSDPSLLPHFSVGFGWQP